MHRLILLMLSATVLLFVLASAAAAEPPVVVTGQTPSVNSGYCSFAVYRSDVFKLTTIAKPDGTLITHIDRVLTFTANGKTLTSNDLFTRFVDPTQPYLIDIAGHLISVELPGQGPDPARSWTFHPRRPQSGLRHHRGGPAQHPRP